MILTKEQKLEWLKYTLENTLEHSVELGMGMCSALRTAKDKLKMSSSIDPYNDLHSVLPELAKLKPKGVRDYWFKTGDLESRQILLLSAIVAIQMQS